MIIPKTATAPVSSKSGQSAAKASQLAIRHSQLGPVQPIELTGQFQNSKEYFFNLIGILERTNYSKRLANSNTTKCQRQSTRQSAEQSRHHAHNPEATATNAN